MKNWVLSLAISTSLLPAYAHAGWGCSKSIRENASAVEAIKFLRPYEGNFSLGSCSIELQVCDLNVPADDNASSFAADIVVINRSGERYIPFFISTEKTKWQKQVIFQNQRAFVYRLKDWNEDPETGKDEKYDIEFIRKENSKELDYIEVGFTSEVERQREGYVPPKWMACGFEREAYLREHPVKHKIKSFWWWLTHPKTR
ncbi:hypothetical protein DOM21_10855 [Bacteriovorax stolpii]|uniref:Uncharacterized protein n=1 Tax=Bacteriovorax stolpii TaxID=960 RepID=A0A2K9NTK8_BACTC|nr:hypothetical protein [Bacteriovorax stolpii]AUN98084.1 hypothetical protein C0V70_08170 [Bacteriovorax stolpii]QDK41936.1 hypothetical protein DOM21_10855 [Bacteriovorax stolpii]TDP51998.1 hypothetical protein C8D79_2644 [Bacteriovorax stolpii]